MSYSVCYSIWSALLFTHILYVCIQHIYLFILIHARNHARPPAAAFAVSLFRSYSLLSIQRCASTPQCFCENCRFYYHWLSCNERRSLSRSEQCQHIPITIIFVTHIDPMNNGMNYAKLNKNSPTFNLIYYPTHLRMWNWAFYSYTQRGALVVIVGGSAEWLSFYSSHLLN